MVGIIETFDLIEWLFFPPNSIIFNIEPLIKSRNEKGSIVCNVCVFVILSAQLHEMLFISFSIGFFFLSRALPASINRTIFVSFSIFSQLIESKVQIVCDRIMESLYVCIEKQLPIHTHIHINFFALPFWSILSKLHVFIKINS